MSKRKLRVLLLEDSAADAELIESALRRSGLLVAIERVDSRESFARALKTFLPDVILSDHSLAQFDSKAAVKMVQATRSLAPVILVTGSVDPHTLAGALHAGVEDAVHKNNLESLAPLVEAAVQRRSRLSELSPRQLEVLRLVAEGLSTPQIAKQLDLSVKTVESHRSEMMKRLEIHDLVGLVHYAVRLRLVSTDL